VVVLAAIQVTLDTVWCTGIVLLASRARRWLSRGSVRRRIERGLGTVLIGLGFGLALDSRLR
jgi:threonine/homoserine/homoserine lactone efflux protein